jgi:hypothetical protein
VGHAVCVLTAFMGNMRNAISRTVRVSAAKQSSSVSVQGVESHCLRCGMYEVSCLARNLPHHSTL